MEKCLEDGFLDCVFGVGMIPQYSMSRQIESLLIGSHEVMKQLALTQQDLRNQRPVALFFGYVRSQCYRSRRQTVHKRNDSRTREFLRKPPEFRIPHVSPAPKNKSKNCRKNSKCD